MCLPLCVYGHVLTAIIERDGKRPPTTLEVSVVTKLDAKLWRRWQSSVERVERSAGGSLSNGSEADSNHRWELHLQ